MGNKKKAGGGARTAISTAEMSAALFPFCLESGALTGGQLLAQARRGNREAFARMVSPYVPTLYRRARGLTGNAADAEDVSQESLLKAWMRLDQFTGKQNESADDFSAWLSRIGTHTSTDLFRQRRDADSASFA